MVQQPWEREFVAALSGYGRPCERDVYEQGGSVGNGVQMQQQQQVVGQLFSPVWGEAEWGGLGGAFGGGYAGGYVGDGRGSYVAAATEGTGRDDGGTYGSSIFAQQQVGYGRQNAIPQVQANWQPLVRTVLEHVSQGMGAIPDPSDRQQPRYKATAANRAHRRWDPYQNTASTRRGQNIHAASTSRSQHQINNARQATPPQSREDQKPQEPTASVKAGIPFFTSFAQAKASIPAQDWRCPASDDTLPTTPAARQDYLTQLLSALNNTKNTLDTPGLTFTKRWSTTSTTNPSPSHPPYYIPQAKESLCWLILTLAERLHTAGPSAAFTSFDASFWADAKRTRDWSFRERITRIAELLARSKSKCDALLGGCGLQLLVGNPEERLRAAVADGRGNERRRVLLGVGLLR